MSVATGQRVVGTTAVKLTASPTSGDYLPGTRADLVNQGAVTLVIGGADVTATTGYRLAAGGAYSQTLDPGEDVYGIVASGSTTVDVIQSGV